MNNYFHKAFLVLFSGFVMLLIYELVYPHVPFLQKFESSHFWTAYKESTPDSSALEIDSLEFNPKPDSLNTIDSTLVSGDSTLVNIKSNETNYGNYNITFDSTLLDRIEEYDGQAQISNFYSKLKDLKLGKRKKIRIAYFGDSTTEGDLIVGDLRDMMQRIFGGKGVGYVSIAPFGTALRRTIKHQVSTNWSVISYFRKFTNPAFLYGIGGDYATAQNESTDKSHKLSFKPASATYPTMNSFDKIYLYYGQNEKSELKKVPYLFTTLNNKDTFTYELNGNSLVNRLNLATIPVNQIDLAFNFPEPFPIYGLSFESETGIIIDNFAKRSDSGSHFGRITSEVLRQFNSFLDVDLIVFHFGANVLQEKTDYTYYEKIIVSTIQHFKQSMGDIPVLIVGSSDRVIKSEGVEKTSPAVYGLIKSQRTAAIKTSSAFLDLFQRMGGEGTMIKWAKSSPQKAAADYVHFSSKGGLEIAKILFNFLSEGYEKQTGDKFKPEQ